VLGKKIEHADLTAQELEQRWTSFGAPEEAAQLLAMMDTAIKNGSEDRLNDVVLTVTGQQPRRFIEYAKSAAEVWQ